MGLKVYDWEYTASWNTTKKSIEISKDSAVNAHMYVGNTAFYGGILVNSSGEFTLYDSANSQTFFKYTYNSGTPYLSFPVNVIRTNLVITQTNTSDSSVRVSNSNGQVELLTSTNRGIYDTTNSDWLWYRNTTDKTTRTSSPVLISSDLTVTGTLVLSKKTDASPTADSGPALVIGGTRTSSHIEIDDNEILAKSNGTTETKLWLGSGSAVELGAGGISNGNFYPSATNTYSLGTSSYKWSNVYATTFTGALSGNATNVTGTVAIAHGGTGATTVDTARTALYAEKRMLDTTGGENPITSGSNLDSYKSVGVYQSSASTITNTLVNCPTTGAGGKLTVVQEYGSGRITQIWHTNDNRFFMRYYNSNTWSYWGQVPEMHFQRSTCDADGSVAITGLTTSSHVIIQRYTTGSAESNSWDSVGCAILASGKVYMGNTASSGSFKNKTVDIFWWT